MSPKKTQKYCQVYKSSLARFANSGLPPFSKSVYEQISWNRTLSNTWENPLRETPCLLCAALCNHLYSNPTNEP